MNDDIIALENDKIEFGAINITGFPCNIHGKLENHENFNCKIDGDDTVYGPYCGKCIAEVAVKHLHVLDENKR